MKTCLKCNGMSDRRVKGRCKQCNSLVFIDGKYFRPECDKHTADDLLRRLSNIIRKRDDVYVDYSKDKNQRRQAYRFIDDCRAFLNRQPEKCGYDTDKLTLAVFDMIVSQSWWYENIDGVYKLKNQIYSTCVSIFKLAKAAHQIKVAQDQLHVDYKQYNKGDFLYGPDRL